MLFAEKPVEIVALKDYIRDWKNIRGGILFLPKSHLHFDKLIMQSQYSIYMERIFNFTSMIELVPEGEMNDPSKHLHNSFVELMTELSWSGFIFWSKPRFKSHTILGKLQEQLSEVEINTELADALNGSDHIIKMLRKVRPKSLHIVLSSFVKFPTEPVEEGFDYAKHLVEYYRNPVEVSWTVGLSKLIMRTAGYKKAFVNIVELLDSISQVVLDVSREHSIQRAEPEFVETIFKRWLARKKSL